MCWRSGCSSHEYPAVMGIQVLACSSYKLWLDWMLDYKEKTPVFSRFAVKFIKFPIIFLVFPSIFFLYCLIMPFTPLSPKAPTAKSLCSWIWLPFLKLCCKRSIKHKERGNLYLWEINQGSCCSFAMLLVSSMLEPNLWYQKATVAPQMSFFPWLDLQRTWRLKKKGLDSCSWGPEIDRMKTYSWYRVF